MKWTAGPSAELLRRRLRVIWTISVIGQRCKIFSHPRITSSLRWWRACRRILGGCGSVFSDELCMRQYTREQC